MAHGRKSKYGLNACLGSLEALSTADYPEIVWPDKEQSLRDTVKRYALYVDLVIVMWSLYSTEFGQARKELEELRRATPPGARVIHILGGVHATAEPELCARSGFDLIAVGEGESITRDIVTSLNHGGCLNDVRGLFRFEDGQLIGSRALAVNNLDDFPSFAMRQHRVGPIEITRGCLYACKFCQTPYMFKARFRHRSIESVLEHTKWMLTLGLRDVRFITPTALSYGTTTFEPDLDAVEELLHSVRKALPPEGRVFFGSFPSELRPEHATLEALNLIKTYADNDNVIIGAQSGSNRMLERSHRGHVVQHALEAVENCCAIGLKVNVDFIFGMPGETSEEQEESILFAKQLASMGARIHAHTFLPLPGTPWSHQEPGRVQPEVRQLIEELADVGRVYGNWEQQEVMAAELAAFESYSNRRKKRRQ